MKIIKARDRTTVGGGYTCPGVLRVANQHCFTEAARTAKKHSGLSHSHLFVAGCVVWGKICSRGTITYHTNSNTTGFWLVLHSNNFVCKTSRCTCNNTILLSILPLFDWKDFFNDAFNRSCRLCRSFSFHPPEAYVSAHVSISYRAAPPVPDASQTRSHRVTRELGGPSNLQIGALGCSSSS